MIRADQALDEILLVVIDEEEPQEVLRLNAEALIEKFKADTSAFHQALANTGDIVANELAKLRDALDREIERRVDDVADNVCDLLEHLSAYLRAAAGTSPELANKVDANLAGDTASKEAERRHAKIAEGAYHAFEGWVIFMFELVVLLGFHRLLVRFGRWSHA